MAAAGRTSLTPMSELLGCRLEGRTGHEAGRMLLNRLYEEKTGKTLPEIAVTDRGKPYFLNSDLHFSITHTKRHAFCVLSDRPVGIDAEEADRIVSPRLAEKILSGTEKARYEASPDKNAALLRLWVLKEAWVKRTGEGLRGYPNQTDFSPDDPRIREIDGCFVAIIED